MFLWVPVNFLSKTHIAVLNKLGNEIQKRKTNNNKKRFLLTHCNNTFTCPWNWKSPITDKSQQSESNECFLSLYQRFSAGSWIKSCSKGWKRLIRQAVQSLSLNKRGDLIQRGNRFLRGRENRNHVVEYFQRFLDGISFLSNQHLTYRLKYSSSKSNKHYLKTAKTPKPVCTGPIGPNHCSCHRY